MNNLDAFDEVCDYCAYFGDKTTKKVKVKHGVWTCKKCHESNTPQPQESGTTTQNS